MPTTTTTYASAKCIKFWFVCFQKIYRIFSRFNVMAESNIKYEFLKINKCYTVCIIA